MMSRIKKGLVIVNTGDGKGKTTAALGLLMRAWGRGMRVGMVQYLKHAGARFGEIRAAEKMEIDVFTLGKGFTWEAGDAESKSLALQAWEKTKELIQGEMYQVLVLDEFTYLLDYEWLDTDRVITWLKDNKPADLHLVITGRGAPQELLEYADLATEMRKIKHPLDSGLKAQPGIEF